MKKSVFREKSMDRISSPEQINDYIRVANPSMWLIIGTIILLLIAGITWSIAGRIETMISVPGIAKNGVVTVSVEKNRLDDIAVGDKIIVNDKVGSVVTLSSNADTYEISALISGVPDGTVEASMVAESIAPISFLLDKV